MIPAAGCACSAIARRSEPAITEQGQHRRQRQTARTIVASSAIAAASPTPSCLNSSSGRVAKTENTAIITIAALVTVPPVARERLGGGLLGARAGAPRLPGSLEHEHRVVHRQPEQDHEREQRQPVDDRAV